MSALYRSNSPLNPGGRLFPDGVSPLNNSRLIGENLPNGPLAKCQQASYFTEPLDAALERRISEGSMVPWLDKLTGLEYGKADFPTSLGNPARQKRVSRSDPKHEKWLPFTTGGQASMVRLKAPFDRNLVCK